MIGATLAGCTSLPLATTPPTVSVLWDSNSPVPSGDTARSATFNGVVCPQEGDCVAYGSDTTAHEGYRPLLVKRRGHAWAPETVPLPVGAKPASDSLSGVATVGCINRACLAVAEFQDAKHVWHFSSTGFERESGPAVVIPVAGAAEAADELASGPEEQGGVALSCWSTTGCMAAISIYFDVGGEFEKDAFELVRFDGERWTTVPSPELGLPSGYGSQVDELSCTSPASCVIVGSASNALGDSLHAWSAVSAGGRWRVTKEPGLLTFDDLSCIDAAPCQALAEKDEGNALVTLGSDGSTSVRDLPSGSQFHAMGCSSQLCAFSGAPEDGGGYLGTGTPWGMTSADADPGDRALKLGNPQTVACASTSLCAAVGGYEGNSVDGTSFPLVEIYADNSWKATTPAFPTGIKSGTLNGVACQSVRDCVAIGQANGYVRP
ncbi:hypothetical protein [Leifsonia sp. EB41]|uniref:hypothetical protein n=1 Tax=Leifsonia sp. EB41 TaxID=3156260 RepID=UPI003513A8B0